MKGANTKYKIVFSVIPDQFPLRNGQIKKLQSMDIPPSEIGDSFFLWNHCEQTVTEVARQHYDKLKEIQNALNCGFESHLIIYTNESLSLDFWVLEDLVKLKCCILIKKEETKSSRLDPLIYGGGCC